VRYDITLKDLLQSTPDKLFEMLTGARPVEFLTVELPSVQMRKPDFVARLDDGRFYHLELVAKPEESFEARMFEYGALLFRLLRAIPLQHALYVGEAAFRPERGRRRSPVFVPI
jgi:predicted transposase YdaD